MVVIVFFRCSFFEHLLSGEYIGAFWFVFSLTIFFLLWRRRNNFSFPFSSFFFGGRGRVRASVLLKKREKDPRSSRANLEFSMMRGSVATNLSGEVEYHKLLSFLISSFFGADVSSIHWEFVLFFKFMPVSQQNWIIDFVTLQSNL